MSSCRVKQVCLPLPFQKMFSRTSRGQRAHQVTCQKQDFRFQNPKPQLSNAREGGYWGVRKRQTFAKSTSKPQAKKKTLMNSARANCSTDALAIRTIRSAPSVHSFKFKAMNQDDAPPARAMMTHRRNSTGISKSTLTRQNRRSIHVNIMAPFIPKNKSEFQVVTTMITTWIIYTKRINF